MASKYSVLLGKIAEEFHLEVVRGAENWEENPVRIEDLNRPALQLTGFFDYFDPERIQIIGRVEDTYLSGLSSEERREFRPSALPAHSRPDSVPWAGGLA